MIHAPNQPLVAVAVAEYHQLEILHFFLESHVLALVKSAALNILFSAAIAEMIVGLNFTERSAASYRSLDFGKQMAPVKVCVASLLLSVSITRKRTL